MRNLLFYLCKSTSTSTCHYGCSAPVQLAELQSNVMVMRSQLERSEAARQAIELELDLVRCTLSKTHTEMLEIRRTTDECVHELLRTYPTTRTSYIRSPWHLKIAYIKYYAYKHYMLIYLRIWNFWIEEIERLKLALRYCEEQSKVKLGETDLLIAEKQLRIDSLVQFLLL